MKSRSLYLAVIEERHIDDYYKLFTGPVEAARWSQEEVRSHCRQDVDVQENICGVNYFVHDDDWVTTFYTYDDGPSARVMKLDAPEDEDED